MHRLALKRLWLKAKARHDPEDTERRKSFQRAGTSCAPLGGRHEPELVNHSHALRVLLCSLLFSEP